MKILAGSLAVSLLLATTVGAAPPQTILARGFENNVPAPSGVYFVRAQAGSNKGFQKIVLLR